MAIFYNMVAAFNLGNFSPCAGKMKNGLRPRARKFYAETSGAGNFLPRFGNLYGERVAYSAGRYDVYNLNLV